MKRGMHLTIDKIAKAVRVHGSLDKVQFCTLLDLSPSTFYNYKDFVTARYEDIVWQSGRLVAIPTEKVNQ